MSGLSSPQAADPLSSPGTPAGGWLLLIESSPLLLRTAAGELQQRGFVVKPAATAAEGIRLAAEPGCAAVLLDMKLSDGDGWGVLDALKAQGSSVPVVFWTERAGVATRVEALERGAQEIVAKDIAWDELAARLRARMRRAAAAQVTAPIQVADLEINLASLRATRAGRVLRLAPREFQLLVALVRRPGVVVTDGELERHVWGINQAVISNALPVAFSRLKRKVDLPGETVLLRRVRGQGYRLDASRASSPA